MVTPLLRRDHATSGQVAFFLVVESADATRAVLVRFAIWWLPVILLQSTGNHLVVIAVGLLIGLLPRLRMGRRSILEVASGGTTVTRSAAR